MGQTRIYGRIQDKEGFRESPPPLLKFVYILYISNKFFFYGYVTLLPHKIKI